MLVAAGALIPVGVNHASPLLSWAGGFAITKDDLQNHAPPPQPVLPRELRLPNEPGARHGPIDRIVRVERGDTLMNLLARQGVNRQEAHQIVEALREVYDPRTLREGQAIRLTLSEVIGEEANMLVGLQLAKSFDRYAGAARLVSGNFGAFEVRKQLDRRLARSRGDISSNLFSDGVAHGIPFGVMAELVRLFSYDVDFQRDIHPGNGFDLLFERYVERGGQVAHDGDIRFAELRLRDRVVRLYRFEREDGTVNYFDPNGESIRKALLRTPIDGARISSGFGMRRHPILGYSRMHRGVDFAAPTGTPIRAAGDGVVRVVGREGGYGRVVRIRHNSNYETLYAHMSRFASGISSGTRVRQGQVIGYVGASGMATGPHLHYEVIKDGEQINPDSLRFPGAETLEGRELARFQEVRDVVDRKLRELPETTLVAQRNGH